jgi:hypothetical protein
MYELVAEARKRATKPPLWAWTFIFLDGWRAGSKDFFFSMWPTLM